MKKELKKPVNNLDTAIIAYNTECSGGTNNCGGSGGGGGASGIISCIAACVGVVITAIGCT